MSAKGRLRLLANVLGELARQEMGFQHGARTGRDGATAPAGHWRPGAVRRAFEELGPFYIKVGQMLSTRPDLVPEPIRLELGKLHDQVTPAPFEVFEPVLAAELGPGWRHRFRHVDTSRPLGAASLAQVYRVTLRDGSPAVIKVQRPGVGDLVITDMRILRRAVRLAGRLSPKFSEVLDLDSMLRVLLEAMKPELDFTAEAANMDRARPLVRRFPTLDVPDVVHATPRLLVQSLAPGQSIRDAKRRDFTVEERMAIGSDLLGWAIRGYFVDRTFHGDPHPGNIFVHPGAPTTVIDWGMVGHIDRHTSLALLQTIMGAVCNDAPATARGWTEMGRATTWANPQAFAIDLADLIPRVRNASLEELDFGVSLTSVLAHATKRGIVTNPMIAVLAKSFANVEGSVRYLAPELSLLQVFRDQMTSIMIELIKESLSPASLAQTLVDGMLGAPALDHVRTTLRDLARHDLGVQVGSSPAAGPMQDRKIQMLLAALATAVWINARRHKRTAAG
ncbi:ABC1 kinase family protein [Actinomadura kijaniata]|uniref:ABC1 kinase family protein n=1 Tax=Actinomadura kijaniata TaxID=46161 RepID=UPI003F1C92E7